jgi:hypothetical protein
MDTQALRPPLFISPRLMAAVRVDDSGATLHIEPTDRDNDGRMVWRYVIEDSGGYVLDDAEIRSGVGDPINARKAMATLINFLGAAADSYRHTMTGGHSDNADMFPPQVMEWAYEHDDELAALALDLSDEAPVGPDALWQQVWAATGCADCAGAAAAGRPWGRDHCWATHRPHTPVDDQGGGPMNDTITLPYLDLTDQPATATLLLTDDQKWTLLGRLLEQHGHDRNGIPEAWADAPLTAWCWLVLTINNLEPDPDHHQPLTHWGIDLSLTSTALRRWIWTIS